MCQNKTNIYNQHYIVKTKAYLLWADCYKLHNKTNVFPKDRKRNEFKETEKNYIGLYRANEYCINVM